MKLSSCYFGPFEILERVGSVVCKLKLPEGSRVHLVFHVLLLKKSPLEGQQLSATAPPTGEEENLLAEPEEILSRHLVRKGNKAVI